jgi:hypothetical protein
MYAMRSAWLRVRIDLMLCCQKYVKSARLLCGSPYVETSFIFVSWCFFFAEARCISNRLKCMMADGILIPSTRYYRERTALLHDIFA